MTHSIYHEVWLQREEGSSEKEYNKWIEGGRKGAFLKEYNTYSVIRFFADKSIVVNYKVSNSAIELRTWYELALRPDVVNSKRRGLLIKKAAK